MQDAQFSLNFEVRDYECDIQGIVNNAVYQHYLEHTRHQFLKSQGLDFAQITQAGINLVVTRIEVDYLAPLKSGDTFRVELKAERVSRLRFGFVQHIYRDDGKLMLRAKVTGTGVDRAGQIGLPPDIEGLFAA